jgi:hypothetical protein
MNKINKRKCVSVLDTLDWQRCIISLTNTNQDKIFMFTHSKKPNTRFHKVGQDTNEREICGETDRQDFPLFTSSLYRMLEVAA